MKRFRTITVTAEWEAEYDFGYGLRATFWVWVFDVAKSRIKDSTLVRVGPIKGGIQGIADALAVESVIAESRK